MKSAVGVEQTGSPGVGAGKLDGSLDAFAARAGEEYFGQPPPGAVTKTFRQFARQFRNVALQHNGAALLQLVHHGGQYVRMIVTDVVNAVSGEKIENATAVTRDQLRSHATFIADGEFEYVQQFHPLGVHVLGVEAIGRNRFR